jgi:hypothetical protein
MKAHPSYLKQGKKFWANVRSIGQKLGYARNDHILVYTMDELKSAMYGLNLGFAHLEHEGKVTEMGAMLLEYFSYRANVVTVTI